MDDIDIRLGVLLTQHCSHKDTWMVGTVRCCRSLMDLDETYGYLLVTDRVLSLFNTTRRGKVKYIGICAAEA